MFIEKRKGSGRFTRLNIKAVANLNIVKDPYRRYECLCTNISATGAKFLVKDLSGTLDLGDEVEISFTMPNRDYKIDAVAKVMWIKKEFDENRLPRQFEIGLEFSQIKQEHREFIRNYIYEELNKRDKV